VQPEEPATQHTVWDAPTRPGNVFLQVISAFSFAMVVYLYSVIIYSFYSRQIE
jgi:hypothetical protein